MDKIELINGEFVVDWIKGSKLGFKSLKDAMLFLRLTLKRV